MTTSFLSILMSSKVGFKLQYKGPDHLLGRRWWLMKDDKYVFTIWHNNIIKDGAE